MFLECLNDEEMAMVESIGDIKKYPNGFHLIEEGSNGSTFILILGGEVEVSKGMRGGKYKLLVTLGACDLVGEIGFLCAEVRTASVVAISDVNALVFEREKFSEFVELNPIIGLKIYRGIAEELAQRLSRNDEDLMDAITWAMAGNSSAVVERCINVPPAPKLKLRSH